MKNIAIIPARSGSKGLPHKNIRPLNGIPLIAYTIKAALDSGMFDTVMVSTDSEEYAEIARQYGAEVPFLRSAETSSDTAGSWPVVSEVIRNYRAMGEEFDSVCLLQPTSPLRDAEDIRGAYAFMQEKKAIYVMSCCELGVSVIQTYKLTESRCAKDTIYSPELNDKNTDARRQDMSVDYRTNGAIYIRDMAMYRPGYTYDPSHLYYYVMPEEKSVDVDTLLDFAIVEAILNYKEKDENF